MEAMVEHGAVCVEEADILEKRNQIPLNAFVARNPSVHLYCVTSKVEALALPCLTDPIIAGWIATQKHRELQVWDGKKVRKFPRTSQRRLGRQLHRPGQQHGVRPTAAEGGQRRRDGRLSVESWLQYESVIATAPPYER